MSRDKTVPQINQKDGYVEIQFPDDMSKEAVEKQVNECIDETCECCTPVFREKVEGFEYSKTRFANVKIFGSITQGEVMHNVASCAPKLKE